MAQRAIPDDLKATLGIGTWQYLWDVAGMNRKGRLYYARLMIPGTNVPYLTDWYGYDAQGNATAVSDRTWFGHVTPGGAQPTTAQQPVRSVGEYFTPSGQSKRVIHGDWTNTDGTNSVPYTQSLTFYDDRGLPLKTELHRTGSGLPIVTLGVQTRNIAGMVTRRLSDQAGMGLAMTKIQSDWTYDTLGRVKEQVISRDAAGTLVAHQKLTYWGADDPKQLRHKVGTGPERVFDYAYDPRHQLTSATETGGAFTGTYTFGLAGRFASASVSATALPGGEVKNRAVTYEYASGVDKEAVSALKVGTADFARYDYYQDGGMKRRVYPGTGPGGTDEVWDYLYDSDDQLKRVIKKHRTGSGGSAVETTVAIEDYLYHHDGARAVVVKRDPAGVSQEVRRFLRGLETKLSPAGVVQETLAHVSMGTVLARVKDRLTYEHQFHGLGGSTLAAVTPAGGVTSAFTYGPYGEVLEASGSDVVGHRRRMNDKYQDAMSGLGYYGVRYYDQVLMGWTQGDPLYRYRPEAGWDEPRRGQLYAFVGNNPLRYMDPDGRDKYEGVRGGAVTGGFVGAGAGASGKLSGFGNAGAGVGSASARTVQVSAGQALVGAAKAAGSMAVDMIPYKDAIVLAAKGDFKGAAISAVKETAMNAVGGKIAAKVAGAAVKVGGKVIKKVAGKASKKADEAADASRRRYSSQETIDQAQRQGGKCEYCGKELDLTRGRGSPDAVQGDHILAHAHGGETVPGNLAAACQACNLAKGDRPIGQGPNEWWPPAWGPKLLE